MNIDPKEIGIGILDLYTQENVQNCWDSIPDKYKNHDDLLTRVYVTNNNNNKPVGEQTKPYTSPIQIAAMRNHLISQMRLRDCKYYFILNSNVTITDPDIFEKTIKLAENFGTWVIFGPSDQNTPIEDDEKNITLNLSKTFNPDFMFLSSNIIEENGYFDEKYFNGKNIDVLDYVLKLRNKKMYPPTNFHPTIVNGVEYASGKINKMGFADIPDHTDQGVKMAYSVFFVNHKYIPTETDPPHVSDEVLLEEIQEIQKKYARNNTK